MFIYQQFLTLDGRRKPHSPSLSMKHLHINSITLRLRLALIGLWWFGANVTVAAEFFSPGCTDVFACNYDPAATVNDGSCDYMSCMGCTNPFACNFDQEALYNDNSCEYVSCAGCIIPLACNFNPAALVPDNEQCDFLSCVGCTDFTACNFDAEATLSDMTTCDYPSPDFDCQGNFIGCGGCEPVFLSNLEPQEVTCVSDLPLSASDDIIAVNGCLGDTLTVGSYVADLTGNYKFNAGTTAEGIGPDGAIRIFGLTALGLASSDYFVETYPLLVSRYSNGIATVYGQVANVNNPNLIWSVHLVLEDARDAASWLEEGSNHGLLTAYGCVADTANWEVLRLVSEQSYLIGSGGYQGSFLQLSHMPFSESKRFQIGSSGNSVNCNYGMGGWFSWSGKVLGEEVMGMSGDLVIDLDVDYTAEVPCGQEMVVHYHNAFNETCGTFTEAFQVFSRIDLEGPVWNNAACMDSVALCFETGTNGIDLPAPCDLEFIDGCGEWVEGSMDETVVFGDPNALDGSPFEILRTYSGEDCAGNLTSFQQTLWFDGTACPKSPMISPSASHQSKGIPGAGAKNKQGLASLSTLEIFISPNPTSSHSILQFKNAQENRLVSVRVLDVAGNDAMPLKQLQLESNTPFALDLNAQTLAPGCYFIRLQSAGETKTLRWVVTR